MVLFCSSQQTAEESLGIGQFLHVCGVYLVQVTMGSGKPSTAQVILAGWPTSAVAFSSDCNILTVGRTEILGRKHVYNIKEYIQKILHYNTKIYIHILIYSQIEKSRLDKHWNNKHSKF